MSLAAPRHWHFSKLQKSDLHSLLCALLWQLIHQAIFGPVQGRGLEQAHPAWIRTASACVRIGAWCCATIRDMNNLKAPHPP